MVHEMGTHFCFLSWNRHRWCHVSMSCLEEITVHRWKSWWKDLCTSQNETNGIIQNLPCSKFCSTKMLLCLRRSSDSIFMLENMWDNSLGILLCWFLKTEGSWTTGFCQLWQLERDPWLLSSKRLSHGIKYVLFRILASYCLRLLHTNAVLYARNIPGTHLWGPEGNNTLHKLQS